ncbi:MAG: hypothetical protein GY737_00125 [Desulfobacteraceae bacterium]|nr:hypothetical protein [Desulfobacteraceae bacterium]
MLAERSKTFLTEITGFCDGCCTRHKEFLVLEIGFVGPDFIWLCQACCTRLGIAWETPVAGGEDEGGDPTTLEPK